VEAAALVAKARLLTDTQLAEVLCKQSKEDNRVGSRAGEKLPEAGGAAAGGLRLQRGCACEDVCNHTAARPPVLLLLSPDVMMMMLLLVAPALLLPICDVWHQASLSRIAICPMSQPAPDASSAVNVSSGHGHTVLFDPMLLLLLLLLCPHMLLLLQCDVDTTSYAAA
jgi:hypothetical protein